MLRLKIVNVSKLADTQLHLANNNNNNNNRLTFRNILRLARLRSYGKIGARINVARVQTPRPKSPVPLKKGVPVHDMNTYRGSGDIALHNMDVRGQPHAPAGLPAQRRLRYSSIGIWVSLESVWAL
jgi:hypothetical protein